MKNNPGISLRTTQNLNKFPSNSNDIKINKPPQFIIKNNVKFRNKVQVLPKQEAPEANSQHM